MKTFMTAFALMLSLNTFAQQVVLDAKKVSVDGASATVVRTNKTPETVEITFRVPMANSVCERYETRHVLRTSGAYCGYDYYERRIPAGKVCVKKNPRNEECVRWETTYRIERQQRPRTCMVPETYCARYGTATTYEKDSMKIQFKNLPALADSESETFTIAASQRAYDSGKVIYEVKPLETLRDYKIKQKKVLFVKLDTYIVEE